MTDAQAVGLTTKQRDFVESIERNTEGLTAVSTGVCPGCEQCRDECGIQIQCLCKASGRHPDCQNCDAEHCGTCAEDCPNCEGDGHRAPTMEEFHEQWSSGEVDNEVNFSWSGCDLCGSSLGGDMEVWHAVDSNGEIIHGEHACVDCVMYLANGDLPEED